MEQVGQVGYVISTPLVMGTHQMCLSKLSISVKPGHWQRVQTLIKASVAKLDAPSDWRPGSRRFNPR